MLPPTRVMLDRFFKRSAVSAVPLTAAILVLCVPVFGRADEPQAATPPPAATAPQKTETPAGGEMDFDLLADEKKPDPVAQALAAKKASDLEHSVKIRRRVLLAHQVVGFATLALMTATVIVGQVNYVARYGGLANGADYDRYQAAHLGLSISTSALFTSLGVLGLAAPNPYPKPIKFDTALVHKVAMALATAGMVTQLILGPITTAYEGRIEQRNLALGHVIAGYATWGFMTAGVLAYVF